MRSGTILIIRHGEKPGEPDIDALTDGTDLSTKGYERAGALSPYVPAMFGKPHFLFATKASEHSNRPVETITPLARAIGLPIHDDYPDNDYGKLASHLTSDDRYAGKLVLICWHHGTIPKLAAALGGLPPETHWPPRSFDRVWMLEYTTASNNPIPISNLPQRLLFGDSPQ
ncbi:histidine phosphatase family protein [Ralstonia syzygii]|uniref:Conserved hypothethical protein n=1 Tax=Ralstonia syzygii R24 TaxID=907261 RepID=G3A6V1_9RALS|nr:histidine phosphatase family protein [Ralstonia syzygii]CCA86209.1 conserved hypothethical protein [Ralstonia syzygii R24]